MSRLVHPTTASRWLLAAVLATAALCAGACSDAPEMAEQMPQLLIQDLGTLVRRAINDERCGFSSDQLDRTAVYDADGERASLFRTVENCQLLFPADSITETDCDENDTTLSGVMRFSAVAQTDGLSGTDENDNPTVILESPLHTTYRFELDVQDIIVNAHHRDEALQLARGHFSFVARPRFAVDTDGGCSALSDHMTLENVQWTQGGVVFFGDGVTTLEGDVQSSLLQGQLGSGAVMDNGVFGEISIKAESFRVAPDAENARPVDERFGTETFDDEAFDDAYSCRETFSQPLSFRCEGATIVTPRPE